MAIKCGNCHNHHDTVVQVKRCHGTTYRGHEMTLVDYLTDTAVFCVDCGIRNTSHQNAAGTVGRWVRSDLHPEACGKVQEELELAPMMPGAEIIPVGTWAEWVKMYRAHQAQQVPGLPGVTMQQAQSLRRTPTSNPAHYRDPARRYDTPARTDRYATVRRLRDEARGVLHALAPEHDKFRVAVRLDGTVHFFQLDTPLRGKWAGCLFMKEQASDETYKVRDIRREEQVLAAVIDDAMACLKLYAEELGSCGMCGRTLTDEESRARGIGPICADKMVGAF